MSENVKLRNWRKGQRRAKDAESSCSSSPQPECQTKPPLFGKCWKNKLIFCGSDCFGLLSIAAKWERLYNPGLCARSFAGTSPLTFQGRFSSRTGRPPVQPADNNAVWNQRPMRVSVRAPFDELWRGESEFTSLSPDCSWLSAVWTKDTTQ